MNEYDKLNSILSRYLIEDGDLNELRASWVKEVQKLHSFLDKFIDRFGSKIMGDRDDSPEWKLYSKQSELYNAYNRAIKSVDYFIQKKALQVS